MKYIFLLTETLPISDSGACYSSHQCIFYPHRHAWWNLGAYEDYLKQTYVNQDTFPNEASKTKKERCLITCHQVKNDIEDPMIWRNLSCPLQKVRDKLDNEKLKAIISVMTVHYRPHFLLLEEHSLLLH